MLITKVLDRGSYEVTLCGDAESALVRIQRDRPYDILISDYMLPGISGLELHRAGAPEPRDRRAADRDDQRPQQLRDGRTRARGRGERVPQQALPARAVSHDGAASC